MRKIIILKKMESLYQHASILLMFCYSILNNAKISNLVSLVIFVRSIAFLGHNDIKLNFNYILITL